MEAFANLKENLNTIFSDIVSLITTLLEINQSQFKQIEQLNNKIDLTLKNFISNLIKIVEKIYSALTHKLIEIDIENLKKEIDSSTSTFIDITIDLELLSYNTICKTLNLGTEGKAIAHISHEIKKHSEVAKALLKELSDNFNQIYENYSSTKNYLEKVKENVKLEEKEEFSKLDQYVISSDITKLFQYSQFHDIYIQQIDKIQSALNEVITNENSPFYTGKKLKIYEEVIKLLEEMKSDLEVSLTEIANIIKDFIYNLNSDVQTIISKSEIVKIIYENTFNKGKLLLESIENLGDFIVKIKNHIDSSNDNIKSLEKFQKSFNVLIILSAIEIARISEKSLSSLTDLMHRTDVQLIGLIKKLKDTMSIWKKLTNELEEILNSSKKEYDIFKDMDIVKEFNEIANINNEMGIKLNELKNLLAKEDFNEKILEYKNSILSVIEKNIEALKIEINNIENYIDEEIKNSKEFLDGYNSSSVTKIKADEEDLSSVELF